MKAIGFKQSLPIDHPESFMVFDTPMPSPGPQDILVKIEAMAVNPVDYKIRQNSAKDKVLDAPKIIGWDAAGIVEAVGEKVTLFKPGDAVYYAGDITRPGCNAEYQLVDERVAGHAPKSLSLAEAAALPLTALTAWEMLVDRMRLSSATDAGKSLLIIGGAGGVGSIAIQVAKQLLGLQVIATASRPSSADWCRKMGADIIVDHRSLVQAVHDAGFETVDFIIDLVDINAYWDRVVELIKPQGHIASITGSSVPLALNKLKTKSASFSWEFMFTRSSFQTKDMKRQHEILNEVARLVDEGTLHTTHTQTLQGLSAENLKAAHSQLESGTTIGKLVITV